MVEDGITLVEEEYDGMIVEECPEADDKEAVDRYSNMELRMGKGTDDKRWERVIKHAKGIGGEPVGHALLGEVTQTKDGHSKNLTRTKNVPPKCNKQVTSKQQTRSFLTSIN
jgi:hypothetical protein